jgi:diaminohydroxyphosphoribosylaminopyrimidine deaminase/5-amino-6-(5-phosphoribosylamino)uracil reductase
MIVDARFPLPDSASSLSFALELVGSDEETGMDKTTGHNPDFSSQPIVRAFARALDLARVHEGATAPNPPVGCVLLDAEGRELAVGAHQRAGTRHAEAAAIANALPAGVDGRIASVVVTLEPCNHHGRTPPCAEAILGTGARQVWIACRDPNPDVVGGGAERLRKAGLAVRFLSEAERLLAPFSKRIRTGLPFVTVKQALSPTGGMVPSAGQKTFTSPASLELAHRLRRRSDAILTGSGTVLADDPLFTVRLVPDHPERRRMLVILDRRRRIADDYLHAARGRGFAVHLADDVHEALEMIGEAGGMEVLVEAGPTLSGHLLSTSLWDEHVLIEQGTSEDRADRVTIRQNPAPAFRSHGKETDVLGHH